jgi:Secretion system C-terminal sorting domain
MISSALGNPQISHCYTNSGTFTVRRTVRTANRGTSCTDFTINVTVNCCPTLTNLNVQVDPSDPSDCLPLNFQDPSILGRCSFKVSPVFNLNTSHPRTYTWNVFRWNLQTQSAEPYCSQTSNLPNFHLGFNNNNSIYRIYLVQLVVNIQGCSPTSIVKTIWTNGEQGCPHIITLKGSNGSNDFPTVAKMSRVFSNSLQVFPNPSIGELNISGLDDAKNYQIELLNTSGQTVFNENVKAENSKLDISLLSTGLYFVLIKTNGQVISTQKIFKK